MEKYFYSAFLPHPYSLFLPRYTHLVSPELKILGIQQGILKYLISTLGVKMHSGGHTHIAGYVSPFVRLAFHAWESISVESDTTRPAHPRLQSPSG